MCSAQIDIAHALPEILTSSFSPVFPPFLASAYFLLLARNQPFRDDPKKVKGTLVVALFRKCSNEGMRF